MAFAYGYLLWPFFARKSLVAVNSLPWWSETISRKMNLQRGTGESDMQLSEDIPQPAIAVCVPWKWFALLLSETSHWLFLTIEPQLLPSNLMLEEQSPEKEKAITITRVCLLLPISADTVLVLEDVSRSWNTQGNLFHLHWPFQSKRSISFE